MKNIEELLFDLKGELEAIKAHIQPQTQNSNLYLIVESLSIDKIYITDNFPEINEYDGNLIDHLCVKNQRGSDSWEIHFFCKIKPQEYFFFILLGKTSNSNYEEITKIPASFDEDLKLNQRLFDNNINSWLKEKHLESFVIDR